MYTKLDLVKACMRAIGNEQPVDLDNPDADEDIAISTVDEAIIDVLSYGWWFNTETNWKLTPNEQGIIFVPDTIIDLRTYRCSRGVQLVKRGGKMYDKTNHTFDMLANLQNDGTIDFDFLMALDIKDCPIVAQQYIREMAVNKFIIDMEAEAIKVRESEKRLHKFLFLLEKQHYRNSQFNVYQHQGVQAVLCGMSSTNSFAGINGNLLGGGSDR